MNNYILGLDVNDRSTSAALVADGRLVAAVQQERLNRIKHTRAFPQDAMDYCLSTAGLSLVDVDTVAFSVNPAVYLETLHPVQSDRTRFRGELLYGPLNYLLAQQPHTAGIETILHVERTGHSPLTLRYIRHHEAHAAAAYYLSSFESAVICSIDAFGEKDSLVLFEATGTEIRRLATVLFPHSLGSFYAAMVDFLGMRPYHDEWKLMAAATLGDPQRYAADVGKLVQVTDQKLDFQVALAYFNYHQFHVPGMTTNQMETLLGPAYGSCDAAPDQRFFDLAAAVQHVFEQSVLQLLKTAARHSDSVNLCMTGGAAYNCVLNGKITANTPFEHVFVPPAPDDSGTSVGAALAVLHRSWPEQRHLVPADNYWGPAYEDAEIESFLRNCGLTFEECPDPAAHAAREIAANRIIGWFQGRIEFGERALGNRSVLADPRQADMPARLRKALKARASYQPFAASVCSAQAGDYFDHVQSSPWMDKVFTCTPRCRKEAPAIIAADGTCRVQTVTEEQNPRFHALLAEFGHLTGLPMVVNTSFNHCGEPIVCRPQDAVRTFFSSGLDTLYLGCYIVRK